MDRASLPFGRMAAGLRIDDFEDTVPNNLILSLQDGQLIGSGMQRLPGHWGLPSSFAPQAGDESSDAANHGFPDTVPYDLDDELAIGAVGAVGAANGGSSGQGLGSQSLLFVEQAPANLRRQALGLERTNAGRGGAFPDTVWQSPSDFLSSCTPGAASGGTSSATCDASDEAHRPVSSKGGSVKPAHWALSTDLDEHATEVALPNLRMVGIGDLRQVESHATRQVAGATRHIVRFRNGGFVRFAYGADESVIELSGERISVRIGVQGDVLITALSGSATKAGA